MTAEEVKRFERCIAAGGVALFPADTVYGLATEPDSRSGVERLYRLKGRPAERPAAVMFFGIEPALAALPELGERTRGAVERLLPGALTLVLPNPGLRVPRLDGTPLAGVGRPVLQSSANRSGGADARRVGEVDEHIRAGVDLVLDGGELPGTPSSVVDLSDYERDGSWTLLREGAVSAAELEEALA
jgi:L-threonylcarbamoyladenylate synthase